MPTRQNLFIVAGFLPIIIVYNIIKKLNLDDVTIIVEAPVGQSENVAYKYVKNLLLDTLQSNLIEVETPESFRYNTYRHPLLYKKKIRQIKETLIKKEINKVNDLYYSSNSFIHSLFSVDDFDKKIMFEHGVGDYLKVDIKKRNIIAALLIAMYKKIINNYLGVYSIFEKKILCDDYQCVSLDSNYRSKNNIFTISPPNMGEIINNISLNKNNGQFISSVQYIKDRLPKNSSNIFLYLPVEAISFNRYQSFLRKQLEQIEVKNAIFIIKPHPSDNNKYGEIFGELGLNYIESNDPIWKYIPVEIILFYFSSGYLIGSATSSFFYSHWWLKYNSLYLNGNFSNEMMRAVSEGLNSDIDVIYNTSKLSNDKNLGFNQ
jgi:hypothetical protein